jgi:DNA polymerase V
MKVKEIYSADTATSLKLPFIQDIVRAGYPSPAADYIEKKLDLNEYLIKHKEATYFIRVEGDSMEESKIYNGDLLIVDRAVDARMGSIVIVNINGEMTVKVIDKINDKLHLVAGNSKYKPIEITEETELLIWGVVTYIVHKAVT